MVSPALSWGQSASERLAAKGIKADSSALITSAGRGTIPIASLLLGAGIAPNSRRKGGVTALYLASRNGRIAMVQLLLLRGAEVDSRNSYQNTPLMAAAYRHHEKVVQWLLESGANVNARNNAGDTALHFAASIGNAFMIEVLLGHGADASLKNAKGDTAVRAARRNNHKRALQLLTPKNLVEAASQGDLQFITTALGKGGDMNARDGSGLNPLMAAAWNGHFAIVKFLVGKRADLNLRSKRGKNQSLMHQFIPFTALDLALKTDMDIAKFLFAKGGKFSKSLLGTMARFGRMEKAIFLIHHGADVNVVMETEGGKTNPLNEAVGSGRLEMARLLLRFGARINVRLEDTSALDFAVYRGKRALVELLINAGADPDIQSKKGRTPLMIAAAKGKNQIVKFLVKNGANVRLKDGKGYSAFDHNRLSKARAFLRSAIRSDLQRGLKK